MVMLPGPLEKAIARRRGRVRRVRGRVIYLSPRGAALITAVFSSWPSRR
jgi:tRNA G37 N-methylase TrmD